VQETATKLLENKLPALLSHFAGECVDATDFRGDLCVVVRPGRIRDVIAFLKASPELPFEILMDLFAMDYLKSKEPPPERFAVVYQLYSVSRGRRVRLKAYLPEARPEIDSIHDVYKAANWFEREAWDLFGVDFRGHPSLVRILCHNEFVGHALRKDYPADRYQRLRSVSPSSGI